MARTVELTVEVDVDTKSLGNLKQEIKDIQSQLDLTPTGTKEYDQLVIKLREAKGEIKDFKEATKGLDPDQRAAKLVGAFQGMTGAIQAAAGAITLFGGSSEDIEKVEKNLLGIIAVGGGIQSTIAGFNDAADVIGPTFTNLGKTIKAGFVTGATGAQTFKAALISTGIGALIVAVGLLVANFDSLFGSAEAAKVAIDDINESLAQELIIINDLNRRRSNDAKIQEATLKQQGASEKELSALRQGNSERDRDAAIASVIAINKAQDAALVKFKGTEKEKEELVDKFATQRTAAIVARNNAETSLELEKIAQQEKIASKAEENRKKREDIRLSKAKNEAGAQKALTESLRKLDQEQATEGLDAITTQYANELARIKEAQTEELNQENLTVKAKEAIRARFAADAETNELARQKAVDEFNKTKGEKDIEDAKKKAEDLATLKTKIADAEAVSEDQRRALEKQKLIQFYDDLIAEAQKNGIDIANLNKAKNDAITKQNEEFATTDLDKQKAYREKLVDLAFDSALSLINDLKSLNSIYDKDNKDAAKKAFDREKSLATVSTIIETYLSASKAYASQIIPGDPTSIIRASIAAAVAVASGLARLKVIQSQQFDGDTGSGPSGGGAAAGGGGGGFTFSQTTQGTFTPGGTPQTGGVTGQGGIQQGGAQTGGNLTPVVKAYVLSGDVTDAQEAELKINQKRKF